MWEPPEGWRREQLLVRQPERARVLQPVWGQVLERSERRPV